MQPKIKSNNTNKNEEIHRLNIGKMKSILWRKYPTKMGNILRSFLCCYQVCLSFVFSIILNIQWYLYIEYICSFKLKIVFCNYKKFKINNYTFAKKAYILLCKKMTLPFLQFRNCASPSESHFMVIFSLWITSSVE